MVVAALVDIAGEQLLAALSAVRGQPAPLGQAASRLAVLAHAARELEGIYLRELASVDPAAEGARSAADLLVDTAGLAPHQARGDAALAGRLSVLPGLLDAVAAGGVGLPAARQLSRAWSALPERFRDADTAAALITLAGLVDLPDLRVKVDELLAALQPEVTDDAVAAAREAGGLSLTDVGAETRLQAHTDVLTGEWLREVLQAKAEADRGLLDGRSSSARLLDALLDIVRASIGTPVVPGTDGADGDAPMLLVIATPEDLLRAGQAQDTGADAAAPSAAGFGVAGFGVVGSDLAPAADVVPGRDARADLLTPVGRADGSRPAGRSARTRGGTHLGPRTLAALCCTARLGRLLLDPLGHPLDSSPGARQLNRRERRALEHRAGYRCERQGCGRPARSCVPHHVQPWSHGGPSTLANTVLLCRSCHHLLHDRQRPLTLSLRRQIGPGGWLTSEPPDG